MLMSKDPYKGENISNLRPISLSNTVKDFYEGFRKRFGACVGRLVGMTIHDNLRLLRYCL